MPLGAAGSRAALASQALTIADLKDGPAATRALERAGNIPSKSPLPPPQPVAPVLDLEVLPGRHRRWMLPPLWRWAEEPLRILEAEELLYCARAGPVGSRLTAGLAPRPLN